MIGLCRILVVVSFAIFWGGLTFYTGVAVRVAHDVLSDPMDGGLITQRVTNWLQLLGAWTVLLMLWNAVAVRRTARFRGNAMLGCAIVLGVALAGLALVHRQLDAVIDIQTHEVVDREAFVIGHRRYNQLTTVEWLASLAYMGIAVPAWRHVDRCADDKPED